MCVWLLKNWRAEAGAASRRRYGKRYFDIEVEIKKGVGKDNIRDTDERREHCSQR